MTRKLMDYEAAKAVLKEVWDVLNLIEVPHFLIQGTALGAYRDHGFTPTERDIDIGFLQEHFEPLALEMEVQFKARQFETRLIKEPFTKWRSLKISKNGIKTDLNAYQLNGEHRFCSSNLKPYSIVHQRSLLEPPYHCVDLFGLPFLMPSPPEIYLQREYGSDWRTPTDTHVSKSRIPNYRKKHGIEHDFLEK